MSLFVWTILIAIYSIVITTAPYNLIFEKQWLWQISWMWAVGQTDFNDEILLLEWRGFEDGALVDSQLVFFFYYPEWIKPD